MLKATRLFIALFILSLTAIGYADDVIVGKVVGVADGDTITVLQDRTQYKIRLYGIDTPESHQDFGNRAKQFTSDLVFGKQVRVVKKDIDRYGRIVGMVYVGDVCVNESLVESGMAWVYRKYCMMEICESWFDLESMAIDGDIGLWSHPNPVAPWEFRKKKRS
ncbi:thermonuclease family protein [uncultured Desulfosarcina sp.]|uniref:thermonuclease family protein n=1 Tax=uncultured Desulfosarcina sp. TaxID=218289 RepID=UPI0029C66F2E|nr:thermonuclease family protein [uncultured Desulfosarcina sp.]